MKASSLPVPPPALPLPPLLPPEDEPNIDHIVIDDGAPVDSMFAERQMSLLTDPLYASWEGPNGGRPFLAAANVGLFSSPTEPPIVPDLLLSLDVGPGADLSQKKFRSYFLWVWRKLPDVVAEIVSNREGGEDSRKLLDYARLGIPYYVIYDPENLLKAGVLRLYGLAQGKYELRTDKWLPEVGLGLALWRGKFKGFTCEYLRWCDRAGVVLPTGEERAEQENQRAEKLAAQLRALGVEPTP